MKTIILSFTISHSSVTDYFVTLCNKLTGTYRVVIITDKIEPHPFALSPKITVLQWPSERPTKFKDFLFLMRQILKYRPYVMISMFSSVNLFLLGGWLCRVKHRIAWHRSIFAKDRAFQKVFRRKRIVYRLATRIFANSDAAADDTTGYFKVPPKKIVRLYNAVRDPELTNTGTDPNAISFVGRLDPSKGFDTLIKAMPKVVRHFPQVKLTVAGGYLHGRVIKGYQKMVDDLGVSNHVQLGGRLDKNQVVDLFSKSYLSVVPSVLEAFGFVVIESFSVATPVVGSRSSGIVEIIRDGVDGLHFTTGDHEDLADKIIWLMQRPEIRQEFSANCKQRFMDCFEIERATDSVASLLIELKTSK